MQRPSPLRTTRPVVGPDGVTYPSIAAASAATGRWPSAIRTSAVLGRAGWRFATAQDLEAKSASGQERADG